MNRSGVGQMVTHPLLAVELCCARHMYVGIINNWSSWYNIEINL